MNIRLHLLLGSALLLTLCPGVDALGGDFEGLEPENAHRELGYLSMDDGVRLAYVVWRPQSEGRFPVLLVYSPYIGGGADLEMTRGHYGALLEYLRHGYAVVGVSIRGTGCSEGTFDLLSERHARDGAAAVEWAGSQPWSTGAVGLFGNSYDGITQYLVAARRPRHLKALAAGAAAGDPYLDAAYPGGIFNASFFAYWSYGGQPMLSGWGVESRLAAGDGECRQIRSRQRPNGVFEAVRSHPRRDPWWQSRDLAAMASRIQAPVLITQAWQDQQVAASGSVRLYETITATKKMVLANGDHGFYDLERVERERLRWYDRWLKGERNGIDTEPPVVVWFEQRDGEPAWTREFATWPVPELEWKTLHLTADGWLRSQRPDDERATGERSYIYPAGTELIGSPEAFRVHPAPYGTLLYRTAPVEKDTALLGEPAVILYLATERKDTDLMVALHDVDPEGRVLYVQRGFLRASHAARAAEPEGEPGLTRSHAEPVPLRPRSVYELAVELPPVGHVLRSGHALELAVLAPNPLPQPDWGLASVRLAGRNTVYHSPRLPSRVLLPVVSGLAAAAPAPECGSLPMQPCRSAAPDAGSFWEEGSPPRSPDGK